MRYLLLLYIILIPSFYIPGFELRPFQEAAYQVLSLAIFCFSFFVKNREINQPFRANNMNVWLGAFGLLTAVLYARGGNTSFMLNVFCALLVYFACIKTIDKDDLKFVLRGVLYYAALNIAYIGLQRVGFDPIFHVRNASSDFTGRIWTDWLGFFGLKAAMGMYFAFAMSLLAIINWWLAALFFLPVCLSYSSGALMGASSGYLFFLWWKKRLFFWIFGLLLLIGGVFYVVKIDSPMGMMNTRPPMWKLVLKRSFVDIRGYGLDSFRMGNVRFYKEASSDTTLAIRAIEKDGRKYFVAPKGMRYDWWDNPHNEYLQLFYEFGLAGVVIFLFLLWSMADAFRRAVKTDELVGVTGAIIALLMVSMTQFPFHLARIGHIVPILLAYFYTESKDA